MQENTCCLNTILISKLGVMYHLELLSQKTKSLTVITHFLLIQTSKEWVWWGQGCLLTTPPYTYTHTDTHTPSTPHTSGTILLSIISMSSLTYGSQFSFSAKLADVWRTAKNKGGFRSQAPSSYKAYISDWSLLKNIVQYIGA